MPHPFGVTRPDQGDRISFGANSTDAIMHSEFPRSSTDATRPPRLYSSEFNEWTGEMRPLTPGRYRIFSRRGRFMRSSAEESSLLVLAKAADSTAATPALTVVVDSDGSVTPSSFSGAFFGFLLRENRSGHLYDDLPLFNTTGSAGAIGAEPKTRNVANFLKKPSI